MARVGLQWGRVMLGFSMTCLLMGSASAVRYEPDITASEWRVQASIFECRMSHGIPFYGDAMFYQKAGEQQGFLLYADSARFKSGRATLTAIRPEWKKNGIKRKNLGIRRRGEGTGGVGKAWRRRGGEKMMTKQLILCFRVL